MYFDPTTVNYLNNFWSSNQSWVVMNGTTISGNLSAAFVANSAPGFSANDFSPNKSPYQLELRVCPKNPAANLFPDVFGASLATRHRQKPIFPIRQGAGGHF